MKDDIALTLEGNPPKWFPSDKQIDFRGKRRDLLTKMTRDDLCHDVQGIIEMHGEHFADANYWKHEYRPATINGIPDTVGHDVAILARYVYAAILGEKKGLPLLMGIKDAGRVAKGDSYGKHMAKIAGNPRGKVGDDGDTLGEIIGRIAMNPEHEEDSAKVLWPILLGALDDLQLCPREFTSQSADDWKKSWRCEYDYKVGRRKPLTGGQFAKIVSAYRTGKKKLP